MRSERARSEWVRCDGFGTGAGSGPRSRPGSVGNRGTSAVCQIVGYKNSGKTSLICALIPHLQARGAEVAVIKHDGHEFEADREGTDTWQHRQAGAAAVAITSPGRTAVIEERGVSLEALLGAFSRYDYVLAEGFKTAPYPKIVLLRSEGDLQLLQLAANIAAVVCWPAMAGSAAVSSIEVPLFAIDDAAGLAAFLWEQRTCFRDFIV